MRKKITLICICLISFLSHAHADDNIFESETRDFHNFHDSVKLRALNKITARSSELVVSMKDIAKFGNLEIALLSCWKAPDEEQPENKSLIQVWEQIPGEEKNEIFKGWMFASSPAISAIEHAVYDLTVIECFTNDTNAEQEE